MMRHAAAIMVFFLTAGASAAQTLDEDARFDAATNAVRDRDFRLAVALFEPLAEADVPDAQFNLAVLLREGRGRPQNHVEALYWSALALLSDGTYAQDMVTELLERLPLGARQAVMSQLLDRPMATAAAGEHILAQASASICGVDARARCASGIYLVFDLLRFG
jgi:uncharacterized protein